MRLLPLAAVCVLTLCACGGGPSRQAATSPTPAVGSGATSDLPEDPAPPAPPPMPPPGNSSVWVNVMGDTGWCGSAAMPQVAALLDELEGDILLAGDLAYMNGTLDDFRRCFDPDFGRFMPRFRPTPGNHDYGRPDAAGYFTYFGARAGTDRRGFYAFRAGEWQVLMLNSVVPINRHSEQFAWVREQLVQDRTRCTLAVLHHPFDSSGPNGPHPWLRDIWELLHGQGADIVASAHDHLYERLAPINADQRRDPSRGIRPFTAGTGGAPLYQRSRPSPNSELVISAHGVLRLRLEPASYEWAFVDVQRNTLDRGVGVCH